MNGNRETAILLQGGLIWLAFLLATVALWAISFLVAAFVLQFFVSSGFFRYLDAAVVASVLTAAFLHFVKKIS